MGRFHIASEKMIKSGQTTDIYFVRTEKILRAKGLDKTKVLAEVTTGALPNGWSWGVISGVEEVAHLLEGNPIDVDAMAEGTVFHSRDYTGYRIPVLHVEGPYGSFCTLETPLLGLICQSSGISTAAAKIRRAAGKKIVINFGARRMHPSLSPLIGRASYVGGVDGVSSIAAANLLKIEPTGTMPHALILVYGDQVLAWKAFDEEIPKDVPRIALVDTFYDEKLESLMATQALGDRLRGIRLDTPSSRKGNFAEIVKEVRWELDIRGHKDVAIYVSGGLNPESIRELASAGADGFGVGTWISNARVIDFAMDIVEREGQPVAKRGKLGGKKQVWRCRRCFIDCVVLHRSHGPKCPRCGSKTEPLLQPLIRNGKIVAKLPKVSKIRDYVLDQVSNVSLEDT